MLRFLIDMFWFPFAVNHPKNKFGYVLQFIMKDYPAYFWVKPTRRKVAFFPLLLVYVICKRQPYESIGFWGQLLAMVFLFTSIFFVYGYRKAKRDMQTYIQTTCTKNTRTLQLCKTVGVLGQEKRKKNIKNKSNPTQQTGQNVNPRQEIQTMQERIPKRK